MDYCKTYFDKRLNEISFKDVEEYFRHTRTETDQLEFKSIPESGEFMSQFSTIQKSVCAFLNSSGGLLIWGAPKGQKGLNEKEKKFNGPLTTTNNLIEKDFLVSKICDSIIPLPNSIRVNPLESEGKSIIVIEIDVSDYSPHQTGNTYYMRIDGQTKPAPHHYVESLFKKVKYPNLEAIINITKVFPSSGNYKLLFNTYFFNWSPLQNEERLTYRILSDGVFEASQNIQLPGQREYSLNGHEFFKMNAKEVFYYGEPVLESQTLLFDPDKLETTSNQGRILVSFGGKFSPRKCSDYKLDFTKKHAANPNEMIISRTENILSKDIHDIKGMTKEKIIQEIKELKQ